MVRKSLLVVLTLVIIFSFASCTSTARPTTPSSSAPPDEPGNAVLSSMGKLQVANLSEQQLVFLGKAISDVIQKETQAENDTGRRLMLYQVDNMAQTIQSATDDDIFDIIHEDDPSQMPTGEEIITGLAKATAVEIARLAMGALAPLIVSFPPALIAGIALSAPIIAENLSKTLVERFTMGSVGTLELRYFTGADTIIMNLIYDWQASEAIVIIDFFPVTLQSPDSQVGQNPSDTVYAFIPFKRIFWDENAGSSIMVAPEYGGDEIEWTREWLRFKSNSESFPVYPQITGVSPSSPTANPSRQWLTINGTGFFSDSQVTLRIGGSEYLIPSERTTFVSSGQIQVYAGLTNSGTWTAQVTNTEGNYSNIFSFQVVTSQPSGTVQGRVLWNEQPIQGSTVYATDLYDFNSTRYGSTTTDENGWFSISGVPEGQQYLYVFGNRPEFWVSAVTPFWIEVGKVTVAADTYLAKGFYPTSPDDGETVFTPTPTLRWEPFPDAVDYAIRVLPQGASNYVFQRGDFDLRIKETYVMVDTDLNPGIYTWRVDAFNSRGHIIGASYYPRSFVIDLATDSVPTTPTHSASVNLAPNPSFELGLNSIDGWYIPTSSGGAVLKWDNLVAHSGTHSISISNARGHTSGEWVTIDTILVEFNKSYNMYMWIKGNSTLDVYAALWTQDDKGEWIAGASPGIWTNSYNSSEWSKSSATVTIIDPHAVKAILVLGWNNPGSTDTGTIWFDDVYFGN